MKKPPTSFYLFLALCAILALIMYLYVAAIAEQRRELRELAQKYAV